MDTTARDELAREQRGIGLTRLEVPEMIEVYPDLFVGTEQDYEMVVRHEKGWYVVHACKEPYHRTALGYQTRGAPRSHPEYLIARRDHRLILNLVDAPNPFFIPAEIVDAAIRFIDEGLKSGKRVLVHCNLGESRGPSIALLYLRCRTNRFFTLTLLEAESAFRQIYPPYNPGLGIRGFLVSNWQKYQSMDKP